MSWAEKGLNKEATNQESHVLSLNVTGKRSNEIRMTNVATEISTKE